MRPNGLVDFDLLATRFLCGENTVREGRQLLALLKTPAYAERFAAMKSVWVAAKTPPVGGFASAAARRRLAAQLAAAPATAARKKIPAKQARPKSSPQRRRRK